MKTPTFTPEVQGAMLSLLRVYQSPDVCREVIGSLRKAEEAQRLANDDLLDFRSDPKSEDPIGDLIDAAANWGASTVIGFMALRELHETLQKTDTVGNG